jgi:hypothetical protein
VSAPSFNLHRVPDRTSELPGLFTVLAAPMRVRITRRLFLGICVSSSALVVLERSEALPFVGTLRAIVIAERAAGFAVPRALSTAGIFSDGSDTNSVEPGYHLRIFSDLAFPEAAFCSDALAADAQRRALKEFTEVQAAELVAAYLDPQRETKPKPLVIGTGQGTEKKPGEATNRVPPMFMVYRRKHYPHFDRTLPLSAQTIRNLRNNPGTVTTIDGVDLALRRIALSRYLENVQLDLVARFLPGVPNNELRHVASHLPSSRQIELLEFAFPRPVPGFTRRVVHNVNVDARTSDAAKPVILEGFVDDDPKPIRRLAVHPQSTSAGARAVGQFVEGHYESVRLVTERVLACTLNYTYMAEDTVVASDRQNPHGAEWQLLDTLPFITRFQTWDSAKAELFRHKPHNRYLDFTAPEVGADLSKKLDAKYAHLFQLMQQVFVRMYLARIEGTPFLESTLDRTLRSLRYEPHVFFELWAMDPNIARLFGHIYPDVPGQQNPIEPELGVDYDYMVTTAWQKPSQRICYITQKVSARTTAPVLTPHQLAGKQVEGFSAETGKQLHRVHVEWNVPPTDATRFGSFEPPLFDIRRTDPTGTVLTLTHRVDAEPTSNPLAARIVDIPVQTPVCPPTSAEGRESLPAQARLALEFLDALHNGDSDTEITNDHLNAYLEMQRIPLSRFLGMDQSPQPRFQDWVEVLGLDARIFRYQARAIDLFGRTSAWSDGVDVKVSHQTQAPEAVALNAAIIDDGSTRAASSVPAGLLRVSWRFGAYQAMSGAPVDHFNICWAPYRASGPSSQQIVRMVYHDILNREPNATELTVDGSAVATRTVTPRQLADRLQGSATNYRLRDPRRYFLWTDLKTNIPYKPPVPFQVVADVALDATGTWTLAGEMTDARVTNGDSAIAAEEELYGSGQRVLTISTNQCWLGIAPFVTPLAPYADQAALDGLDFRTGGITYPIVSFEPGEVLRVGIVVPASTAATFMTATPSSTFELQFDNWRSTLRWTQTLRHEDLPVLEEDAESTEDADTEPAEPLVDREVVRVRLERPLSVEITGRESWLTDAAVVKMTHGGRSWRTELREFAAISVSADALHFGRVLAASPDTGRKRVLAVDVQNAGSAALVFNSASVTGAGFFVETTPSAGSVAPESSITVVCGFAPDVVGAATGTLMLSLGEETLSIPLRGEGAATLDDERTHPVIPTARKYLAEVALAQIAHEGPPEFADPNPIPVFDAALVAALDAGATVDFEIEPIEVRRLVIDRTTTDGTSETQDLLRSVGGDMSFTTADERVVVCEAITRPDAVGNPGEGNSLSFVIRKTPRLPLRGEGPDSTHQCVFHHVYREDISLAGVTGLPLPDKDVRLAVAVSTHKVPAGSESVDAESLVSAPARLKLLEPLVVSPMVAPPTSITPTWSEPFSTIYATRPKVVDNRTVVQARLTVTPGAADIEVLRASLDALRAAIVLRIQEGKARQPVPTALVSASWMQAYGSLPAGASAGQVFQMFESLSEENRYRLLATMLVYYWGDPAHTLQYAFRPVGKVAAGNTSFTDEIAVAAEGSFFYAVRTIEKGANPSTAQLCGFRVAAPDRRSPSTPEYLTIAAIAPQVLLRWGVARNEGVTEYRVYRSPMREATPRDADLLLSFTPAQAAAQPDTYLAPIEATRARRRLVVRAAVCRPWLPDADFVGVHGVYRSDLFDKSAVPLISQTATNFYQAGSLHNTANGAIENLVVSASDGPEPILATVVFECQKRVRAASPLVVQSGTVVLPAGGTVLGVYGQTDFDFSANPISAQQISNWLSPSTETDGHLIANLALADGTEVVVAMRDAAGAEAAIERLPVQNSRVFVPFGPRLVDVLAVFDESDAMRSNNLFQGAVHYDKLTRTLSNLSVADGTRIVVDVLISDYESTEYADFGSVRAPLMDSTQTLAGIFEAAALIGATVPVNLLNNSNLLRPGLLQEDSQLAFNLPATSSLRLGFVLTSASGQTIVLRDKGRYQVVAGGTPAQSSRYSVVAVRQFAEDSTRTSSVRSGLAQCVI